MTHNKRQAEDSQVYQFKKQKFNLLRDYLESLIIDCSSFCDIDFTNIRYSLAKISDQQHNELISFISTNISILNKPATEWKVKYIFLLVCNALNRDIIPNEDHQLLFLNLIKNINLSEQHYFVRATFYSVIDKFISYFKQCVTKDFNYNLLLEVLFNHYEDHQAELLFFYVISKLLCGGVIDAYVRDAMSTTVTDQLFNFCHHYLLSPNSNKYNFKIKEKVLDTLRTYESCFKNHNFKNYYEKYFEFLETILNLDKQDNHLLKTHIYIRRLYFINGCGYSSLNLIGRLIKKVKLPDYSSFTGMSHLFEHILSIFFQTPREFGPYLDFTINFFISFLHISNSFDNEQLEKTEQQQQEDVTTYNNSLEQVIRSMSNIIFYPNCFGMMYPHIKNLTREILVFIDFPNPRVRSSALDCLDLLLQSMCSHHKVHINNDYYESDEDDVYDQVIIKPRLIKGEIKSLLTIYISRLKMSIEIEQNGSVLYKKRHFLNKFITILGGEK